MDEIAEAVEDFFATWDMPWMSAAAVDRHTAYFMANKLDKTRLGSGWGYDWKEALRNQLMCYVEDVFDYEDPRIGE